MDINKILSGLQNCPCGHKHTADTKVVEIESGLVNKVGEILERSDFPKKLLLVSDKNEMKASEGVIESLTSHGFILKKIIYDNLIYATKAEVDELKALCSDIDGIISVGSGSCNDICRVVSHDLNKRFAIFATAPSMDGFASDTAPIIENNFKSSWKAWEPEIIIADTKILAHAPLELKAAGLGDMVAKYIGLLDWKISNILTGEYYCESIGDLTREGIKKVVSQSDKLDSDDEESVRVIMEGLVLSGIAMKLAGTSRPASGAEHVVSHYWECQKLIRGMWPEFHGKKVGVATVIVNRLYRRIAEDNLTIETHKDETDWAEVKRLYGPLADDMMKCNTPTITDKIDPAVLKEKWPEIRKLILDDLPTDEALVSMMKKAGAATTIEEVNVTDKLLHEGLKYHPYMRYRVLLTRLFPMMNIDIPEIGQYKK